MTDGNTFLPGCSERHSELRGVRLRWFDGGAGTTLLFLHGFGGAATNWTAVAPALAERFRVIVPDLPGHGCSSALPAPPQRLDPYAERLALLLERANAAPAFVVGHSLGGVVALRLALRRPDLVSGLVLAGSAGIGSTTRQAERMLTLLSLVQPAKRISRSPTRAPCHRSSRAASWRVRRSTRTSAPRATRSSATIRASTSSGCVVPRSFCTARATGRCRSGTASSIHAGCGRRCA